MTKQPLVSVAIPAYKDRFLKEAICSILSQDYENLELIIVNDHSPADIRGVVSSIYDKRIRYYENEKNMGGADPAACWDKCLSYATGEFFCILCDDDLYEPSFISTLLSLAEQYPNCDVFRARCQIVDKRGSIKSLYASSPAFESSSDYMYHVFKGLRQQTISEFLYRTEHIKEIGGYVHFPLAWHSDYWSIFSISKNGGIASTNKILVTFRLSGENISSKLSIYGIEKARANYLAFQKAKVLIDESEEPLKTLLSDCLRMWKNNADKRLIAALKFKEKIKVFKRRKDFEITANSIILGFAFSLAKFYHRL